MESKKEEQKQNPDNRNEQQKVAGNNPSKAMDSKRDVENSNDPKTDQDFPGYPHYPAKEDIMDKRTDNHRVDVDVENIPNSRNTTGVSQRFAADDTRDDANEPPLVQPPDAQDYGDINPRTDVAADRGDSATTDNAGAPRGNDPDLDFSRSTEGDVTHEERMMLGDAYMPTQDDNNLKRATMDTTDFDGEQLNEDSFGEVLSSADLDIPEETDETETSSLGQGDEENKYYSLGSDRHDSDEEDPNSGPERDNM